MARLFVLVEGETEETFVNEVLVHHLFTRGFHSVSAKLMGNARMRNRRGGIRAWPSVQQDIVRHLRHDREVYVTTMVDYYALPQGEGDPLAWPGRSAAAALPFEERAIHVESSLMVAIQAEMGDSWNPNRFLPFVVMHEFEGLLFSDCEKFATGIADPNLSGKFQQIRDAFSSPEEINDSPLTHPSKRVVELIPGYQKPLHGNLAAIEIGLPPIREQCPHFRSWMERLEAIP